MLGSWMCSTGFSFFAYLKNVWWIWTAHCEGMEEGRLVTGDRPGKECLELAREHTAPVSEY